MEAGAESHAEEADQKAPVAPEPVAHTEAGDKRMRPMRVIDAIATAVVYGGILMFLWVMLGAVIGAAWAVATRVYGWLI